MLELSGQWWQIFEELTLADAIETIRTNPILHPS
jgi:hypothetical protein